MREATGVKIKIQRTKVPLDGEKISFEAVDATAAAAFRRGLRSGLLRNAEQVGIKEELAKEFAAA